MCSRGDIRLVDGEDDMTGRVEICNENAWGTVCDDLWGTADAQVACRQLGFSTVGKLFFFDTFSYTKPLHFWSIPINRCHTSHSWRCSRWRWSYLVGQHQLSWHRDKTH